MSLEVAEHLPENFIKYILQNYQILYFSLQQVLDKVERTILMSNGWNIG
jgi:hypothetical protein